MNKDPMAFKSERDIKTHRENKGVTSTVRTTRKSKSVEGSLLIQLKDKSFLGDSLRGNAMRSNIVLTV